MKTEHQRWQRFYEAIGQACYAVAAADRKIHPLEINAMKAAIKEYWVPLEDSTDEFGSDQAFQAEMTFESLCETDADGMECLRDFLEFASHNPAIFTEDVRVRVMETAHRIASAYSGENKSELVVLSKLHVGLFGKH